eukprot:4145128-Pyramimonas_sp.AAC.1
MNVGLELLTEPNNRAMSGVPNLAIFGKDRLPNKMGAQTSGPKFDRGFANQRNKFLLSQVRPTLVQGAKQSGSLLRPVRLNKL